MKPKYVKISVPGWGVAREIDLTGIRPANDHIEWISSASSCISNNQTIWGYTLFDHRSGNDSQGLPGHKYDKYLGLVPLGSNSILALTYMSSFKTKGEHHSEAPIDPYILLTA